MVRKKKQWPLAKIRDRFLDIKYRMKFLKAEEISLQVDLKALMIREGMKKVEGTGKVGGLVTLCTRVTTIYPDYVKQAIKDLKEKAELNKEVTYETSSYIQTNWPVKKEASDG